MIELTLEQAKLILRALKSDLPVYSTAEWGAIHSLIDDIEDMEERYSLKPTPAFTVHESHDGNAWIIWDTVKRMRHSNESFAEECYAQEWADELNSGAPVG